MRIAWGITGAGHFLKECVFLMNKLKNRVEIDVFLSRAGKEVMEIYKLMDELKNFKMHQDSFASSPVSGRFSLNRYKFFVVAPATSNTVAKFVCGISDSLITNLFAQAGKSKIPVAVLPTDISPEIYSWSPDGRIKVFPRKIDLKNVKKLSKFENTFVFKRVEDLEKWIESYL